VILEKGFDGATMRGIASQAGCTTGLVTHYFANKEALLLMMVRRIARRARERIDQARAGRTGLEAVRAIVIRSTVITPDVADEWRIWIALWDHSMSNRRLRAEWIRRVDGWKGLVRIGFDEAVEQGELAPDAPIEEIIEILGALHYGLGLTSVLSAEPLPPEQVIDTVNVQLDAVAANYPPKTIRARAGNRARPRTAVASA
jgi:AcrR family transcriptional regulator